VLRVDIRPAKAGLFIWSTMKTSIYKDEYDDYYEIFIEHNIECYEDDSKCDSFRIFRAEDDNRIVGIGFDLCELTKRNDI